VTELSPEAALIVNEMYDGWQMLYGELVETYVIHDGIGNELQRWSPDGRTAHLPVYYDDEGYLTPTSEFIIDMDAQLRKIENGV
jgi:hypothetical protein